jgi:hypothetical protein
LSNFKVSHIVNSSLFHSTTHKSTLSKEKSSVSSPASAQLDVDILSLRHYFCWVMWKSKGRVHGFAQAASPVLEHRSSTIGINKVTCLILAAQRGQAWLFELGVSRLLSSLSLFQIIIGSNSSLLQRKRSSDLHLGDEDREGALAHLYGVYCSTLTAL